MKTLAEHKAIISAISHQLITLPEGQSLSFSDSSRSLSSFRGHIYRWLASQGLKSQFRLSQISPTHLLIYRIPKASPQVIQTPSQRFIEQLLLTEPTFIEAQTQVQLAVVDLRLTQAEALDVLEQLETILT